MSATQCDLIADHSKEKLKEVPKDVLSTTNLKMLFLEGNRLQTLPEEFFYRLPKLMWVDLRNNQLICLPTSVAYHKHLENLLLTNNKLEKLPNELGTVPNLKVLQVADNPLTYPSKKVLKEGTKAIKKYLKQQFELGRPKSPVIFRPRSSHASKERDKNMDKEEKVLRVVNHFSKQSLGAMDEVCQVDSKHFIRKRDKSNTSNKSREPSPLVNELTSRQNSRRDQGSLQRREVSPRQSSRQSSRQREESPRQASRQSARTISPRQTPKAKTRKTTAEFGINFDFFKDMADSRSLQPTLRVKKLDPPVKKQEESIKIVHNIHKQGSKISLKSYFNPTGTKKSRVVERNLKEGWLNKLRVLLEDQERILQQERNLKTLTIWRNQRKEEATKRSAEVDAKTAEPAPPPYATDPDYSRIPTREELTQQLQAFVNQVALPRNRRNEKPILNIEKLLDDMEEQLREMQKSHTHSHKKSPREEIDQAEKQIQAIMDIHRKLLRLKTANDYY